MKKITLFLFFVASLIQIGYSQTDNKFTIKAGRGYFVDYTALHVTYEDFENPLLFQKHVGNNIFFEASYKMPNNYSIGFKLAKANYNRPYNDFYIMELLKDNYSITSLDFYEIMFGYDWRFGKHCLTLNAGPVFQKYADSFYNGAVINELTYENGIKTGTIILSDPIIIEREWWDFGINPGISYEFFLTKSVGIGVKAETYFLAYYGFTYLTISPTIAIRI